MLVFLNGEIVPEQRALVSVFDRAFLYGDGLFESVRIFNGRPFRWALHMDRFSRGAEFLKIQCPFTSSSLIESVHTLVQENQMPDCLLRLTLSRGVGIRGYSTRGAQHATCVMSLHPMPPVNPRQPPRWNLVTSNFRLPAHEPLAQFKTCNKLVQILARSEADAVGADEALVLNSDGNVVEATSGNLFWINQGTVTTPPLVSGILPGVTRAVTCELCREAGLPVREQSIQLADIRNTEGIFLSLSSAGLAECASLDGNPMPQNNLVNQLCQAYWKKVDLETGSGQ